MIREHSLASSPLILKNTLFNLLGYGAPLIVAVFAIPLIVKAIGTERFGILTLAWVLTGYLSLLDLGLGRALTKIVAEKIGENRTAEIPGTIWTALSGLVLISIAVGLIFWSCSHWVVFSLLKIPDELKIETLYSFYMLSAFIPVVVVSVGFRGVLEAYQRFDMVNAVRIPLGVFSFAAPLLVIPFSVKLYYIIAILFLGRVVTAVVQFYLCRKITANLLEDFSFDIKMFGTLLRFGGWMTVTNVISPMLVYLDRFFIGALLSIAAVAFYATPSEVITKLTLVSGALISVLFPAISATYKVDRQRAAFLVDRGLKYVFIVIFPIVLLIVSFAFEGLRLWLNEEFARSSKEVTQILSIGIFYTCIGHIPYTFIQGAGRPDLTGKLHLLELPVYILILSIVIRWAGIIGAATVWTIRSAIDTICLYIMAQRLLGTIRLRTINKIAGLFLTTVSFFAIVYTEPIRIRIAGCSVIMTIFVWITFRYILSAEEKKFIKVFMLLKK
jgi:O-antigen/teichoic acid export membrane protein